MKIRKKIKSRKMKIRREKLKSGRNWEQIKNQEKKRKNENQEENEDKWGKTVRKTTGEVKKNDQEQIQEKDANQEKDKIKQN